MKISRRDFVAYGSGILSSLIPFLNTYSAKAETGLFRKIGGQNILVIIHLAGGNDWFNTIIPYQSSRYYLERPSLAISPEETIRLDDQFALHPALVDIKKLYDENCVSVLLNVGHLQAKLSHHRAIEDCQYLAGDGHLNPTWQGRYAKYINKDSGMKQLFPAINVQPNYDRGDSTIVLSSLAESNKFEFDLDMHYKLNADSQKINYKNVLLSDVTPASFLDTHTKKLLVNDNAESGFVNAMRLVSNLIKQKTNASIYNISLGGFDTHSDQAAKHAFLLQMLSKGLFSFQADLEKNGLDDRVLTLVFLEFGRSLKENDYRGTDHGYVNHVLAIGKSVKGGIYANKGLYDLDGTNRYNFDCRSLYSTILNKWLFCSSETILELNYETMSFI